jgi:hypothetical protein
MMMGIIDLFSLSIGGIIGVIATVTGFYIKYRNYLNKFIGDLSTAIKDGRIDFKEFLFMVLDAYSWKTGKRFIDVCNEVKQWMDEWVKE